MCEFHPKWWMSSLFTSQVQAWWVMLSKVISSTLHSYQVPLPIKQSAQETHVETLSTSCSIAIYFSSRDKSNKHLLAIFPQISCNFWSYICEVLHTIRPFTDFKDLSCYCYYGSLKIPLKWAYMTAHDIPDPPLTLGKHPWENLTLSPVSHISSVVQMF